MSNIRFLNQPSPFWNWVASMDPTGPNNNNNNFNGADGPSAHDHHGHGHGHGHPHGRGGETWAWENQMSNEGNETERLGWGGSLPHRRHPGRAGPSHTHEAQGGAAEPAQQDGDGEDEDANLHRPASPNDGEDPPVSEPCPHCHAPPHRQGSGRGGRGGRGPHRHGGPRHFGPGPHPYGPPHHEGPHGRRGGRGGFGWGRRGGPFGGGMPRGQFGPGGSNNPFEALGSLFGVQAGQFDMANLKDIVQEGIRGATAAAGAAAQGRPHVHTEGGQRDGADGVPDDHEMTSETDTLKEENKTPRASSDVDFTPPVDVYDLPSAYVVHVSLPGANKEDVSLAWDAEASALNIAGVVARQGDEEMMHALALDERPVGCFERKIRLGREAQVEGEAISARMENGVLLVTVPKVEEFEEVRKVDIE